MTKTFDPADDGARMTFRDRMSYGDYLGLDAILDAQHPQSSAHDELLFIVQHQTSELWLKLALHEMEAAATAIAEDRFDVAFKMLSRVSRILEQLNGSWDVLRTMTPSEYAGFRDSLGQSSGFQSYQYRALEFLAGNRNPAMLKPHAHRADLEGRLRAILARPSLYDQAIRLLGRRGLPVGPERADLAGRREESEPLTAAWATVYRNPTHWWDLYELAEKLVDFEDTFRRWRFNHVTTVERIIGFKRGTGGTSGVSYLRRMLDVVLFPELWRVRTEL